VPAGEARIVLYVMLASARAEIACSVVTVSLLERSKLFPRATLMQIRDLDAALEPQDSDPDPSSQNMKSTWKCGIC
jgi:hypothetical protein